ncbi:hypothetical protein KUCAC02_011497, partial [Chaenocephalus aceratus]
NGDSACRQTDVDRQAPGALPSHWWRDPDFTAGSAAPVGCQPSTEQQAPPPPPRKLCPPAQTIPYVRVQPNAPIRPVTLVRVFVAMVTASGATVRNGDSACRQTDVDRQAPGALPSHWWRDPDFTAGSAAPVGCQPSTEQQAPPPPPRKLCPPAQVGRKRKESNP